MLDEGARILAPQPFNVRLGLKTNTNEWQTTTNAQITFALLTTRLLVPVSSLFPYVFIQTMHLYGLTCHDVTHRH
jgi:hypothetical protein